MAFGRDGSQKVVRDLTYRLAMVCERALSGADDVRASAHVGRVWSVAMKTCSSAQPAITRVVIVKDRLTLDGIDPLKPLPNGSLRARQFGRPIRRLRGKRTAAPLDRRTPTSIASSCRNLRYDPMSQSSPRSFFENERKAISVSVLRIPSSAATCSVTRSLSCSCCFDSSDAIEIVRDRRPNRPRRRPRWRADRRRSSADADARRSSE